MDDRLSTIRTAARNLLRAAWEGKATLTRKAASFVGQTSVTTELLSEAQSEWLDQLLTKAGLSPAGGGHD